MAPGRPESLIPPRPVERVEVIDICISILNTPAAIHLLYLFSKGEQAELSPAQKQIIGALSQDVRKER